MSEQPSQGYRSLRLRNATAGTDVLPANDLVASRPERVRSALLDIAALAPVLLGPRRHVEVLGERVPLRYEFRRWQWRAERCVELGLGYRATTGRSPEDVLEVGNVLPLSGVRGHTVVDKYEQGPSVINEDILDYDPGRRFGLVVCLSTLEHIGFDEIPQDLGKAAVALKSMRDLVADDGALLVTIPVGYHRRLEEHFASGDAPLDSVQLLVKRSRLARWEEAPLEERGQIAYGRPYANGNAILVGAAGRPFV